MKSNEVQAAIYSALSTDATLTALLSQDWDAGVAVFPFGPSGDAQGDNLYPYVSFQPQSHPPFDDKGATGGQPLYQVNVWTRTDDFDQGATIADRIIALLHRQTLSISGANHVDTGLASLTPTPDPDGITRRHLMLFRILYTET